MTAQVLDAAPAPPAHVQIVQMPMGHWISRIVHFTATLGLADHLADGARSAEELAGPTGTHAPSLYRLMRTLSSPGLLSVSSTRRFALTRTSSTTGARRSA